MATPQPPVPAGLHEIRDVLHALHRGDLSARVGATRADPAVAEIARTLDAAMDDLQRWTNAVSNFASQIASGRLGAQIPAAPPAPQAGPAAPASPPAGAWALTADRLNGMAHTYMCLHRNLGHCIAAAQYGNDFSRRVSVEVDGEMLELKTTLNELLDRLHRDHQSAAV